MTMISVNIFRVVNRFPGHKSGIIRRFIDDGTFREVCEDYLTCLDALEHWQQSDRAESASRKKEYEMLLGELEEEIILNLNSS